MVYDFKRKKKFDHTIFLRNFGYRNPDEFVDKFITQRGSNLAVVKLDFNEEAFVQKNIVDRAPLNTRIAGYGGTISKYKILVNKIIQDLLNY